MEWFKAELLARRRRPVEILQHLYREISRLVSLAYPSEETRFSDHVGKEAFIRALNDGPLQMEVMKGEPSNLETALNYATKYEAYEHSLISQGTFMVASSESPQRVTTIMALGVPLTEGQGRGIREKGMLG